MSDIIFVFDFDEVIVTNPINGKVYIMPKEDILSIFSKCKVLTNGLPPVVFTAGVIGSSYSMFVRPKELFETHLKLKCSYNYYDKNCDVCIFGCIEYTGLTFNDNIYNVEYFTALHHKRPNVFIAGYTENNKIFKLIDHNGRKNFNCLNKLISTFINQECSIIAFDDNNFSLSHIYDLEHNFLLEQKNKHLFVLPKLSNIIFSTLIDITTGSNYDEYNIDMSIYNFSIMTRRNDYFIKLLNTLIVMKEKYFELDIHNEFIQSFRKETDLYVEYV